jgi:putative serine protease PepD
MLGVLSALVVAGSVNVALNDDNDAVDTATRQPATTERDETGSVALAEGCQSAADIYESVRPAVVQITAVSGGNTPFGGGGASTGTGIIIDEDGHILTNNHVINGADTIEVRLDDRSTAPAEVIGADPANDLAIIQMDTTGVDITVAELGDSDELRIGDPVLALGNPFNLEGSLTQGIVSGKARTSSSGASARPIRGMIQTDAAVNPGNSGGPLLNCQGEVVGVNTLLENPTGENVNVGVAFAVSVNTAKQSIDDMMAGETVEHPWLGIAGMDVTPAVAEAADLSVDHGAYVTLVNPGSPAADAGIRGAYSSEDQITDPSDIAPGGDVITEVDGTPVDGIDQLAEYLSANKEPGDTVTLTVVRDGDESEIEATLENWPD